MFPSIFYKYEEEEEFLCFFLLSYSVCISFFRNNLNSIKQKFGKNLKGSQSELEKILTT